MIACVTKILVDEEKQPVTKILLITNMFSFFLSKLIRNFLVAANKYQNLEEDNQKTCII